jgi:hypothetical protein
MENRNAKLDLVRHILRSLRFRSKSLDDQTEVLNKIVETGEVSRQDVFRLIQEQVLSEQSTDKASEKIAYLESNRNLVKLPISNIYSSSIASLIVLKQSSFSLSEIYIPYPGHQQRILNFETVVRENKEQGFLIPKSYPINREKLLYMVQRIEEGGPLDAHSEIYRGSTLGGAYSVFRSRDGKSINANLSKYARHYASLIKHISFQDFQSALQRTVNSFNHQTQDPFILLSMIQGVVGQKNKSNYWATNLAYEYFNPKPSDIITYAADLMEDNQGSSMLHFVIVDDGTFSGSQLAQSLLAIEQNIILFRKEYPNSTLKTVRISLIIPFVTQNAIDRLLEIEEGGYRQYRAFDAVYLYYDTLLPIARRQMPELGPEVYGFNKPVVYFDHKMPDAKSIDLDFMSGMGIRQPDGKIGFIEGCFKIKDQEIECPIPPYKKNELA